MLEHYNRLSFELSRLLERHVEANAQDVNAFIDLIEQCERVHITTHDENRRVQGTRGDYIVAGIKLVEWSRIAPTVQEQLWHSKLRGQVCNASTFAP